MNYINYNPEIGINIAVIGATGMVGITALKILQERKFPIQNIYAVASKNSAGNKIPFGKYELTIKALNSFDFHNVDIALFCTGADISKKFIPKATKSDCIVIDNSSHFRMNQNIPLIVPEVNLHDLKDAKKNIIANPNCVAIPLAVTLAPLHQKFTINHVTVSTYQSVSGAGKIGIDELQNQTKNIFEQKNINKKKFSKQIAFNLIPHIDSFEENGFTKEETKIRNEIKKIIDPAIDVVATCVRVPVFYSHSISINIEFKEPISTEEITSILQNSAGVTISNDDCAPIDAEGKNLVYVSRIRKDPSRSNRICMWIVSDNIRKGAALNAIQIVEYLLSSVTKESQHKKKQVDKVHI